MAKSALLFLAAALCFSSFLGFALAESFLVVGQVYCDPCRGNFVTRVSEYLPDSKVRLECKGIEAGNVTVNVDAVTDKTGTYKIEVEGDHEDEVCEIVLVSSSKADCTEIAKDEYSSQAARISLTNDNGIIGKVRLANPLGFLKKDFDPVCAEVYKEMGILPENLV